MTLDDVRASMKVSHAMLVSRSARGRKDAMELRREFIMLAFSVGHDIELIAKYLNRKPFVVLHAIRFELSERHGPPYSRTEKQLRTLIDERLTA